MPSKFVWVVAGVSVGILALTASAMSLGSKPDAANVADVKYLDGSYRGSPGAVVRPLNSQFAPVTPGQPSLAARIRGDKLEIIQRTLLKLEQTGYHPDPVNVRLAMDDAPIATGYAAYARLPRAVAQIERDRDDPPDMNVACFSMPTPYAAYHLIVKSDKVRVLSYRNDFYGWIVSGCADAIRTNGQMINGVQQRVILRDVFPDTPEYAEQRREMLTQLNSHPPVRRYNGPIPNRTVYPVRPTRIRPTPLPR